MRKEFIQDEVGTVGAAAAAGAPEALNSARSVYDIYPVPPVAWLVSGSSRKLNPGENDKLFRFLVDQGVKKIVYGGNAMVYHMTLHQYSELVEWLSGVADRAEIMLAVGPSFGRALDQAAAVRGHRFHSLLVLPSTSDPRDAQGLEIGLREIAETAELPLSLYIRDESNFGSDRDAGLDVIGRLVDEKICSTIKYALVRKNPADDPYLRALLTRVDASRVISGIGERPAVVHLSDFKLAGFTTGSGVVAPALCRDLLNACHAEDYAKAEDIRSLFLPLEDLRDSWSPPKVLHYAVASAGIANTGPVLPYLSPLSSSQLEQIQPVAKTLFEKNKKATSALT
jgi:dihydrodipicolinate synthase/N-acetylneuraminate lyase